jgi:hypothetical protein
VKALVLGLLVLLVPATAHAGEIDPATVQLWDVVYTNDGSVVKGVIVEEIPGTSYKLTLAGGGSLVIQMANVQRITRELNPSFAAGAPVVGAAASATGTATATAVAPPVHAASGIRIGILPGVAVHSEVDDATFLLAARAGYELGLEQWGVTPSFAAIFAPGTAVYGGDSFGLAGSVRAAYRAYSVAPVVGFGMGVDFVSGDPSLATYMTLGLDLMVHRRAALMIEGRLHRGFGGTYTDTLQMAAVGMGVEIRL